MKKSKIGLSLVLAITLTACTQKIDTKAEGEKLMQLSRDWSAAAATNDIEKILSYWSDDAVVISAGEPVRQGKEAIRKMVEGSMKNPSFKISWEPQRAEISASGDMGYLIETTKISMNDSTRKPMIMNFTGLTVWKKQPDGTWKNVVDVLSPEKLH